MNNDVLISDDFLHRKVHLCIEETLVQLINEPMHITATSTTGIDLICVSNMDTVIRHGVIKTGLTDHYMPFLVRKAYIQRKAPKPSSHGISKIIIRKMSWNTFSKCCGL